MFKAIHGITPNYLSDRIDMHFDIHGYDTREDGSIELVFIFQLSVHKEIYRFLFIWVANFGMICQIFWRTLQM